MKIEDFEWYLDDDNGGKFIIREHGRDHKVIAKGLNREQAGALLIVHNVSVKVMWDRLIAAASVALRQDLNEGRR